MYFVIIRGPAGVGKSTISRLLAKKIKADVVHFDEVMEKLKLDYMEGEKWIPLFKFLKADKIVIPRFKKILKNKNLIIDGNFYHEKQIKDLIKNLKSKHYIFTLKADLDECIKRDEKRKNKLGKKAVKDVYKLVSKFDNGIIIDVNNKNSKDIVKEILNQF